MRKLIHVPMLHPPETLKGMSDTIGNVASESSASISQEKSEEFWEIVKNKLAELHIVSPRFYLESYTDQSFTVEPGAAEVPLEVHNPDEEIIVNFLKRVGGTVEKTEDRQLLEEIFGVYRDTGEATKKLQESMLTAEDDTADAEFGKLIHTVMDSGKRLEDLDEKRDDNIVRVITQSLQDDEVGILFLGGRHKATSKLPSDIQVEILDPRLTEILQELRETSEARSEIPRQGPEGKL